MYFIDNKTLWVSTFLVEASCIFTVFVKWSNRNALAQVPCFPVMSRGVWWSLLGCVALRISRICVPTSENGSLVLGDSWCQVCDLACPSWTSQVPGKVLHSDVCWNGCAALVCEDCDACRPEVHSPVVSWLDYYNGLVVGMSENNLDQTA